MINMDDPRHARLRRIVSARLHPAHDPRSSRTTCSGWPTTSSSTPAGDTGRCDFVSRGRGPPAAQDHLRHDGRSRESDYDMVLRTPTSSCPAADPEFLSDDMDHGARQHADAGTDLAAAGHQSGRAPARAPHRRPHLGAGQRQRRRRAAAPARSSPRSSSCSWWPATRRPATRFATGWCCSPTIPTSAACAGRLRRPGIDGAVEEIVRWASPVIFMRRTVTRDDDVERARLPPRATRSCCSTTQPTATRTSSTTRSASTSPAPPTRMSASAAPGRISASARTWPGARSRVMFRELLRPRPRHPRGGRARPPAVELHQRHQAPRAAPSPAERPSARSPTGHHVPRSRSLVSPGLNLVTNVIEESRSV